MFVVTAYQNYFVDTKCWIYKAKQKKLCVSGYMPLEIREGRSDYLYFLK